MKRFLTRGDKAKLTMTFRGREMSHMNIGKKIMGRIVSDLNEVGEVEKGPMMEGRNIMIHFMPRPSVGIKNIKEKENA